MGADTTGALSYVPKQFALIIPALVEIEELFYGNSVRLVNAITLFCKRLEDIRKRVIKKEGIKPEELDISEDVKNIDLIIKDNYLHYFYRIGQSFRQWNFLNMTYQDDPLRQKFQEAATEDAKHFARELLLK